MQGDERERRGPERERGRAGSENGRRERPVPTTKGSGTRPRTRRSTRKTSEHRAHRDTPLTDAALRHHQPLFSLSFLSPPVAS